MLCNKGSLEVGSLEVWKQFQTLKVWKFESLKTEVWILCNKGSFEVWKWFQTLKVWNFESLEVWTPEKV